MSSLRLALKKSLQESGLSSSKSTGKQQQRQKERRESGPIQRKRERRRPGDPPRKRGRPRKHPLPEQITDKEGNEDDHFKSQKLEESSDENEFSDSNESTNKTEEEEEGKDHILKNNRNYDGDVNKILDDSSSGVSTSITGIKSPLGDEDVTEEEIIKHREKKLLKRKQRDTAANVIQSQWKKNKKAMTGNSDNGLLIVEQNQQSSSKPSSRSTSPKPDRNEGPTTVEQNAVEQTIVEPSTNALSQKSGKRDTVPAPAPEIIDWISGMPLQIQRESISTGLRVKVRFATKVRRKRDGKIIRKYKWFGGLVTAVSTSGHMVKIKYDDGTTEESKFPDKDIIVDDEDNEKHRVSVEAFQPTQMSSTLEKEIVVDKLVKNKLDAEKAQPLMKVEEEMDTADRGTRQASDDEVKSEQNNKIRTNATEQSPNHESETESTGKSQHFVRETETDDGTLSETICGEMKEETVVLKEEKKIPEVIAGAIQAAIGGVKELNDTVNEKNPCIETASDAKEQSMSTSSESEKTKAEIRDESNTHEQVTSASVNDLEKTAGDSSGNGVEMEIIAQGSGLSEVALGVEKTVTKPQTEATKNAKKAELVSNMYLEAQPEYPTPISTENKSNSEKERPSDKTSENVAEFPKPIIQNESETKSKADAVNAAENVRMELSLNEGEEESRVPDEESMSSEKHTEKSVNQTLPLKRKRESHEIAVKIHTSMSVTATTDRLVPQIKTETPAEDLAKPVATLAKKLLRVKVNAENPTEKESAKIMSSDNSAFEKKERRPKVRKEQGKDVTKSVASVDVTSSQEKIDKRSGRRAAQQANERISSRQEHVIQENNGKSKKKKEKLELKLTASLNRKKRNVTEAELDVTDEDNQWVQCDKCSKWRVLPSSVDVEKLPNQWYCEMNKYDPTHNSCDAPEQTPEEIAKARRKAKRRQARQRARQEAEAAANVKGGGDSYRKERPRSPLRDSKSKKEEKQGDGKKRVSPMPNGSEEEENQSAQTDSGSDHIRESKKSKREEEALTTSDTGISIKGKQRGRSRRSGKESKEEKGKSGKSGKGSEENQEWVQCEKCEKWRRLPPHISASDLPDVWYCTMNDWDPSTSSCDAAEDKADPNTHQTVNPFGHVGLHKLSYRSLIFGSGKKLHRPISERMRAAESLFSSTSLETPETAGSYPRVMYANSSMFVNRSNAARAAEERDSDKFSFLNLMSRSNLWAELRFLSKQMNNPSSSEEESNLQLPTTKTSYSSFPIATQKEMKDMVFYALGSESMAGHEVLFEAQCRPWDGVPKMWTELKSVCTIESIMACLQELVKDGRVEVFPHDKELCSEIEDIPRFRRVIGPSLASLAENQKERQNSGSRHIKICKPWKQ
mmetsp:Transcript_29352/g.44430  ORF Transcript_29352/g.44430 Transcript_29352/m.44430 type:complete len:1363 (-) Transcript_29352:2133-6221(-)